MKIKNGFELRTIGQDKVIVPEGIEVINFNKLVSLNETAAFLFETLKNQDFDIDMAVKVIVDHYDIDEETAMNDVTPLIDKWLKIGLLER